MYPLEFFSPEEKKAIPVDPAACAKPDFDWEDSVFLPFPKIGCRYKYFCDGFRQPFQCLPNWCWAAAGAAVYHYYHPASRVNFYQVVHGAVGAEECAACPDAGPWCNCQSSPFKLLHAFGHLAGSVARPAEFSECLHHLSWGRPMLAICRRELGNQVLGHVVAISGVTEDNQLLTWDPNRDCRLYPYEQARRGLPAGEWIATLFTCARQSDRWHPFPWK